MLEPSASQVQFQPTLSNHDTPAGEPPADMVWIPGGEFSMGAMDPPTATQAGMHGGADARPIHRVYVDGFWMEKTDVTNAQFEKFVRTRLTSNNETKRRFLNSLKQDFVMKSFTNLLGPHN